MIAGGSPLRVTDCSSLGQACQSAATVGQAAIEQLQRVDPYPRDGTFLRSVNSTFIYRIAGGAPLQVRDFSAISGWRHFINVNQSAIEGLRAYPRDGTLIRVVETGDLYRIKGGLPVPAGNCSSLVSRCRHALALPSGTIDQLTLLRPSPVTGRDCTRGRVDPVHHAWSVCRSRIPQFEGLSHCDRPFPCHFCTQFWDTRQRRSNSSASAVLAGTCHRECECLHPRRLCGVVPDRRHLPHVCKEAPQP